jgi:DNA repair exonuclease SbcCD ATPase subunit
MAEKDLFDREQNVLEAARTLLATATDKMDSWSEHYKKLLDEFKRVVNQSQKLIRLGDMMQQKLNTITEELQIEIENPKKAEAEKERVIDLLQEALAKVKQLSGFIPICAACKKIRDDKGFWQQIEQYIREHSEAEFTHSICPDCAKKLYPELYLNK